MRIISAKSGILYFLFFTAVLSGFVNTAHAEVIHAGENDISIMYGFRSKEGKYYLKLDADQKVGGVLCLKNDTIVYKWTGMTFFKPADREQITRIMEEDIEKGLGSPGIDLVLFPDGAVYAYYNGRERTVENITAAAHPSVFTIMFKNGRIRECILGKELRVSGIRCTAGEIASFYPNGHLKTAITMDEAVIKGENYTLYSVKGSCIGLTEDGEASPFDGDGRLIDDCVIEIASDKIELPRGSLLETGPRGTILNRVLKIDGPYMGKSLFNGSVFIDRNGYPLSVPDAGIVYTQRNDNGKISAFFTPHRSKDKEWNAVTFNKDMYVAIEKLKAGDAGYIQKGNYRLVIQGASPGNLKGFFMPEGYRGGLIIKPDGLVDRYAMLISRGWFYLTCEKPDDAIPDFNAAIALEPELPGAYLNLAHCYNYYKKDRTRALALYEDAFSRGEKPFSPLFYDLRSDGRFMKEILRDPDFSALQKKYKKRK